MRYLAAYLLTVLSGKAAPDASDIDRILGSVGVEKDPNSIDVILRVLKGKKIEDLINEGKDKLASVPSGASSSTAAVAAPVEADTSAAETKKDEKPEKEESDSDDDLGLGLFD